MHVRKIIHYDSTSPPPKKTEILIDSDESDRGMEKHVQWMGEMRSAHQVSAEKQEGESFLDLYVDGR